jgi:tetratricopeptide (TPR) repeat protein
MEQRSQRSNEIVRRNTAMLAQAPRPQWHDGVGSSVIYRPNHGDSRNGGIFHGHLVGSVIGRRRRAAGRGNRSGNVAVIDPLPPSPQIIRRRQLDAAIALDPDAVEARFERASLLREQGSFEEAKRDFLELLRCAPTHFGALNDFGTMLLDEGFRDAARMLFGAAVQHHPRNPTGHVNLANLLLRVGERPQARAHFEAALRIDPDHLHAHRGMGNLLAETGDEAGARRHRDRGFKNHCLTTLPYRGEGPPVRLLLLVSALGGNIPMSALLDDRVFQATVAVTEYLDLQAALPPHDLVFNSIGDADLCREGLEAACAVLTRKTAPVINDPAAVLATGRLWNAERLRGVDGVVVPRMATLPRLLLCGAEADALIARHGIGFPLLLRAPGFHTGRHFVRADTAQDLAAAAAALPGNHLWIIEHLDARGVDGKFMKCRVMIVDGRLYPLHLAVSADWKVHYFTADMADSAEHRARDAEFLENMAGVVGPRGMAALAAIGAALGLDYGGIDFAVNADGEILFFEANATMVVYLPASDPRWGYRRAAVERVLSAVRAMLMERSAVSLPAQPKS